MSEVNAVHIISPFGPPETCYTYCNMFIPLQRAIGGKLWNIKSNNIEEYFKRDTDVLIFEDFPSSLGAKYIVKKLKKIRECSPNIKIVSCPYDPPNFPIIESCIKEGVMDSVVLFDQKFKDRFEVPELISDNILNEDMFDFDIVKDKDVCYYGHLYFDRRLPAGVDKINQYKLADLYREISSYKKGIVFSSGVDENRNPGVNYNKVKAIEYLMCGTQPYVEEGIDYKNYNKFFKSFDDYGECCESSIDTEEIKEINRKVIQNMIKFIIKGVV